MSCASRAHDVLHLILVERRHPDAPHAAHAGERLRQLVGGLEALRDGSREHARANQASKPGGTFGLIFDGTGSARRTP